MNEGITAIQFDIFMLQREIITVTDVFEKYKFIDFFLYFITLYDFHFLHGLPVLMKLRTENRSGGLNL
jgi:hypothetical protein